MQVSKVSQFTVTNQLPMATMSNSSNTNNNDSDSDSEHVVHQSENSNKRASDRPLHGLDYEGPPRDLLGFMWGTFNPLKPLLTYATKQSKRTSKDGGGSCDWKCNMCVHPWVVVTYSIPSVACYGYGAQPFTLLSKFYMTDFSIYVLNGNRAI